MYALLFKTINWALNTVSVQGLALIPRRGRTDSLPQRLNQAWRWNHVGELLVHSVEQFFPKSPPKIATLKIHQSQSVMKLSWSKHSPPVSRDSLFWDLTSAPVISPSLSLAEPRIAVPSAGPHRGLLRVLRASCQSECHSAASLADEVWTMENKVGARGASWLNEPISQIIRLVDMLIFLP